MDHLQDYSSPGSGSIRTPPSQDEPSTSFIRIKARAAAALVDSKGDRQQRGAFWGTTREQLFDHERTCSREMLLKLKGLVSAEGIEPSTY